MPDNETPNEPEKSGRHLPKAAYFLMAAINISAMSEFLYQSVTVMYLMDEVQLTGRSMKMIRHGLPVIGIISLIGFSAYSENNVGKFTTIIYTFIISFCGDIILIASTYDPLNLPKLPCYITCALLRILFLPAHSTAIVSFGGDQFYIPDELPALQFYYTFNYWSGNIVAIIMIMLGPYFRQNFTCLGMNNCYILLYGTAKLLSVIYLLTFLCGMKFYIYKPVEKNVIVKVLGLIKVRNITINI